jgi:Cu2+-exporting ATPase
LAEGFDPEALAAAAPLAAASRHPLARSLASAAGPVAAREGVVEIAGQGLEAGDIRLGSRSFAGDPAAAPEGGPELWLSRPGHAPAQFCFRETLRPDAAASVAELRGLGLSVRIASGDREASVARIAAELGVSDATARMSPLDKIGLVERLRAQGHRVMMVGDGLNDGPSLAAASVSASPSSAADISQTTADVVFQGDSLAPVAAVVAIARQARAVMRENIGFSIAYNAIMLPLAVAGWVTPWLAAAAMSSSSLIVMLNSFRLSRRGR